MRKYFLWLMMAGISGVLPGCTSGLFSGFKSPKFIALPENLRHQAQRVEIYVEKPQAKIKFDFQTIDPYHRRKSVWAAMGVGGFTELARHYKFSQEMVKNLQPCFERCNLSGKFASYLGKTLQTVPWIKNPSVRYISTLEDLDEATTLPQTDSILSVKIVYKLSPLGETLMGTAYVTLYPHSARIQKLAGDAETSTPILKFHAVATHNVWTTPAGVLGNPSIGTITSADGQILLQRNVQLWAANHGTALKYAIETTLASLMLQIERSLKNPDCLMDDQ
jgi:hypothetical protein